MAVLCLQAVSQMMTEYYFQPAEVGLSLETNYPTPGRILTIYY
jgi:hypothetical protein